MAWEMRLIPKNEAVHIDKQNADSVSMPERQSRNAPRAETSRRHGEGPTPIE